MSATPRSLTVQRRPSFPKKDDLEITDFLRRRKVVDSRTATITRQVTGIEGGVGTCQVLGTLLRCGTLDAARANGTAAHALDFDDIQQSMMGHPSVAVLPAVLALAEACGRTGKDALLAYLTGLEVACVRISG